MEYQLVNILKCFKVKLSLQRGVFCGAAEPAFLPEPEPILSNRLRLQSKGSLFSFWKTCFFWENMFLQTKNMFFQDKKQSRFWFSTFFALEPKPGSGSGVRTPCFLSFKKKMCFFFWKNMIVFFSEKTYFWVLPKGSGVGARAQILLGSAALVHC